MIDHMAQSYHPTEGIRVALLNRHSDLHSGITKVHLMPHEVNGTEAVRCTVVQTDRSLHAGIKCSQTYYTFPFCTSLGCFRLD